MQWLPPSPWSFWWRAAERFRYTPEQNGLIERFLRSLNEKSTWQTNYRSFRDAKRATAGWIES